MGKAARSSRTRKAPVGVAARRKSTKPTSQTAVATPVSQPLPSAWALTVETLRFLWLHKLLFGGIALVYGLITLVLVRGFAGSVDVSASKQSLGQYLGTTNGVVSSLAVYGLLLGNSTYSSGGAGSVYGLFALLFSSLAIIWALRQVFAGKVATVKAAYYNGPASIVPFLLVLLVIVVQLLPMAAGASLYALVVSKGIAIFWYEQLLWLAIFLGLTVWSFYMVTASAFGLYIVTLSGMTPLKALRSARALVRGRRWTLLRKIIALPLLLLIALAVIIIPIIAIAAPLAQWVFFVLTMAVLVVVHAYLYRLYREML